MSTADSALHPERLIVSLKSGATASTPSPVSISSRVAPVPTK